jgi:cytochrome c55X
MSRLLRLARLLPFLCTGAAALAAPPAPVGEPGAARQQALIHMVRQDCGSCHGMKLTGGLGPALTREAMVNLPLDSLVATIFHGRPGTPMPPWSAMLNEAEARWIAEHLQQGFPEEPVKKTP